MLYIAMYSTVEFGPAGNLACRLQGVRVSNDDGKDQNGLVFGDVGGWISGPCLDAGRLGGPRFGLNVGAWMTAYPDFVLQGSQDGRGFRCRRQNEAGRPSGLSIAVLREIPSSLPATGSVGISGSPASSADNSSVCMNPARPAGGSLRAADSPRRPVRQERGQMASLRTYVRRLQPCSSRLCCAESDPTTE